MKRAKKPPEPSFNLWSPTLRELVKGDEASYLSPIEALVHILADDNSTVTEPSKITTALLGVLLSVEDSKWALEYAFNFSLTLTPEFKAFKADYIKNRVASALDDDESEVQP